MLPLRRAVVASSTSWKILALPRKVIRAFGYGGGFQDGSVGGDVAVQHGDAAVAGDGMIQRADAVGIVHRLVFVIFFNRVAVNGHAAGMQHGQQTVQEALHAAGLIKVLQIIGAAGLQVGNQRDFVGALVKERPPVAVQPGLMCDSGDVKAAGWWIRQPRYP